VVNVTVHPAPNTGIGLTGRYYNDPGTGSKFTTLAHTRTDAGVNFDWGSGSPVPGAVQRNNFSVRWTGQVQAPVSGSYTFSTVSDDGVRLWVNGVLLINNWTDHAPKTNTAAPISLVGGTKYSVVMEFYERSGGAVARLRWAYPGQGTQAIPQSRLYP
jgi:PA14 domain